MPACLKDSPRPSWITFCLHFRPGSVCPTEAWSTFSAEQPAVAHRLFDGPEARYHPSPEPSSAPRRTYLRRVSGLFPGTVTLGWWWQVDNYASRHELHEPANSQSAWS